MSHECPNFPNCQPSFVESGNGYEVLCAAGQQGGCPGASFDEIIAQDAQASNLTPRRRPEPQFDEFGRPVVPGWKAP